MTDNCGTGFFFSFQSGTTTKKPTSLILKCKNRKLLYKFLRSKVVFNFKISSSLLGHYFSTLVLSFSSMCVQILDLIRQPWGLGILLRGEFRAHNGVKFLIKKEVFLILCPAFSRDISCKVCIIRLDHICFEKFLSTF